LESYAKGPPDSITLTESVDDLGSVVTVSGARHFGRDTAAMKALFAKGDGTRLRVPELITGPPNAAGRRDVTRASRAPRHRRCRSRWCGRSRIRRPRRGR